jgi:molecular chaperone GrpE
MPHHPRAKMGLVDNENLEPKDSNVTSDDLPAPTPEVQLDAVTAERDHLAAEKLELQQRLLRRQADFENLKRRAERERSEFFQFAAMELAGDLLPVLDDFERALQAPSTDKEYVRGIELIYQRFYDTLKKMGLEPVEAVGKPFDPNVHQAIDKVATEEAEDQTVLAEYQRGYNFKGKLLRPSMVRVAVRP